MLWVNIQLASPHEIEEYIALEPYMHTYLVNDNNVPTLQNKCRNDLEKN